MLLPAEILAMDSIAHELCITASRSDAGTPEAVFCYDMRDGAPLGHALGTVNGVGLPPEARLAGKDKLRDVKVVHTHPDPLSHVSLSDADLNVLWLYPGVTEIDAVTFDRSWFRARRIERDCGYEQAAEFAFHAIKRVRVAEARAALCDDNTPADEEALHLEVRSHLWCEALDKLGFIKYTFSLDSARSKRWTANAQLISNWVTKVVGEYRRPNLR